MLRALVRIILESQLEDMRMIDAAWNTFVEKMGKPKVVQRWLTSMSDDFVFRIPGVEIAPWLSGFVLFVGPDSVQDNDRFLDISGHTGKRQFPEKQLQIPLNGDFTYKGSHSLPFSSAVFRSRRDGDPHAIPNMLVDYAREGHIEMDRKAFFHEMMHALHADRAGMDVMQKSYMGPSHPTTKKRMNARIAKTLKHPLHDPAVATDVEPGFMALTKRSSEGYATLDGALQRAYQVLKKGVPPTARDLVQQVAPYLLKEPLALTSDEARRRTLKMLTKMWNDAAAERGQKS